MKKNYMKSILKLSLPFLLLLIIIGCTVRLPAKKNPDPAVYGIIDQRWVIDGFPKKGEPWIVFSERGNNTVYMNKWNEKSPKEIKFLEPLMVVKHRRSKKLVKVAEYNPDALMQKLSTRSVKTYGWVPEDQLLLWRDALKNKDDGFTIKGTLVPNNVDVINNADKYIKNDSVYVFDSPSLSTPSAKKLPIGKLVYIYKQNDNNKRYLIGKSPEIKIDSIKENVYGWVSSNMVAYWGERSAIKMNKNIAFSDTTKIGVHGISNELAVPFSEAVDRSPIENIFPLSFNNKHLNENNKTKFFTNAFDYSKNFVFNVLGDAIYYNRYKEVIRRNKRMNVVFAIDISNENVQNTAIAKSTFQDIQLKFKNIGYYNDVKYGVVLYKNNPCGDNIAVSNLSNDYNFISKFIDENILKMTCNSFAGQPLQEALGAAGELLSQYPDETNLIVAIGSTAPQNVGVSSAVRAISQARARLILFQSVSRSSNDYNNFVLAAENIVTTTGKNIAQLKKENIVDQREVVNKNNYSLVESGEGFYSLDYPNTSMSQGYVIYPKKGEVSTNILLIKSLDSLVKQVTHENIRTDLSLRNYFQANIGSSKTELKAVYTNLFPGAPHPIPMGLSTQLVTYDNPFLVKGTISDVVKNYSPAIEKGILISATEYEDLRQLYQDIYKSTILANGDFNQARAINRYISIIQDNHSLLEKMRYRELSTKPMAYTVGISTGFDNSADDIMSQFTLRDWKKDKIIPKATVQSYFKYYKDLADKLLENKNNPKIRIVQNGETFYWLNPYFSPTLNPVSEIQN